MNTLRKITLFQFRNYSTAGFEFNAPVTCITGLNGSGKTNLLDAVYYLCYTKSYFSAYQQNSVQHGVDGFRVEGLFTKDDRTETISCKWKQGKKDITADGVEYERPTDHIGKYAAVMIAPDDMELVNEGSEGRRRWVDSILGQVDREYLERLMQYQRVLLQRNAWLKMQALKPSPDSVELEYYNEKLASDGTYIYDKRRIFINQFVPILQSFYQRLSGGREQVTAIYESDLAKGSLEKLLKQGLEHDLRLQRTLRGVHKDDWDFVLNGLPLKQYGSQGQKKSFLFALKLAQYAYLSMEQGHLPILLLDDIFEKLDQQRMEALLNIIKGPEFGQVILTDTHAERVREAFGSSADIGFIHLQ
ncbi:MAG: DNA replication/repair protein RecF [Bacteroidetes bacterium]|nr:DNA replication/repair protein RecF [Bacteroidota bacterium]